MKSFLYMLIISTMFILTSIGEAAGMEPTIDVYAGPGTDYTSMGTINKNYVKRAVKIENDWIEIECNGLRGYVHTKSVPELCTNDIPRVVYSISQNVTLYPQIMNSNIDFKLYDDAEVYRSPSNTESTEIIKAGQTVKFLCVEKNTYAEYAQFEVNLNGQKWRAYSRVDDLLSLDNPLKDFENVKKTNGIVYYKGKNYYSSTGIPVKGVLEKQWKLVDEKTLVKSRFDILAGLTNMIAANSDSCDDIVRASGGQYYGYKFYNSQHNRYENVNLENAKMSGAITVADAFIGGGVNFLEGGNKGVYFKIDLLECDGEYKIVIRTDTPIEAPYAGQETNLDTILVQRDHTNFLMHADDKAIKEMYPDLRKDKTYSVQMIFSNNLQDNPYGYYIVFDKNLKAYAVPIIHPGTAFNVYSEHKMLFNAAIDLGRSFIPVNDSDSQLLKAMLEENGFHLTNTPVEYNKAEVIEEKKQNKNIPSDAKEYAGHHYYVYANVCNTWDEAEKYCESLGGHLAVINDANENQMLYDMMKEYGYSSAYFGLTDLTPSGNWRWINNDSVTYTNWNLGEPNHERGKEHYGMFYWKFKYTWNDGDFGQGTNSGGNAFICEWDSGLRPNVANIEEFNGVFGTEEQMLRQLVGTYQGSYFPTQGETGLTLTVFEENQKFKALFDFYNLPRKTNSKSGKYYMNVSYDMKTRQYVLDGYEWIDRPGGYVFVDLRGTLLNGILSGTSPWKFSVRRVR